MNKNILIAFLLLIIAGMGGWFLLTNKPQNSMVTIPAEAIPMVSESSDIKKVSFENDQEFVPATEKECVSSRIEGQDIMMSFQMGLTRDQALARYNQWDKVGESWMDYLVDIAYGVNLDEPPHSIGKTKAEKTKAILDFGETIFLLCTSPDETGYY